MVSKDYIEKLLSQRRFFPVIKLPSEKKIIWLDLTANNKQLVAELLADTPLFSKLVFEDLLQGNIGVGGYGENRIIYLRSNHYQGEEPRSVHLGMDIWMAENTPIYAPFEATIHSFQDNQGFGNYGPTLILEHRIEGITFYTLYGHLSRKSMLHWRKGNPIQAGEEIGSIGAYPENGDWPPHLHFQVMTSLEGNTGDFPGVASPSQASYYLEICPDPNLILQLPV